MPDLAPMLNTADLSGGEELVAPTVNGAVVLENQEGHCLKSCHVKSSMGVGRDLCKLHSESSVPVSWISQGHLEARRQQSIWTCGRKN